MRKKQDNKPKVDEEEVEDGGKEEQQGDGGSNKERNVKASETKDGVRSLPKETAEDLMPFPLNRSFQSQSVLSEELKDAIWKRVMEDGKSVRDVSAALGVEMRRVGAVVRLKAVEKEWEKQVGNSIYYAPLELPFFQFVMMRKRTFRLVLKTSIMVTNKITTL